MKKNLWLLCSLIAIAFSACTNDDVLPADHTPATGKKVQVTAYTPGEGGKSRLAFAEDETANTISLSWEDEESFSVIRGEENQTFSKNGEGNTFEGVLPSQGTGTYYAVYPANVDATNHEEVPYDLSVQTGEMNSNSTYMYASSTTGTEFQFHHTTAVLKATFEGMANGSTIKEAKVILPVGKAKGTLNLTDGAMTGDDTNIITVTYTSEPEEFTYIYLPPMDGNNKKLIFVVTTSDGNTYTATLTSSNENDIEAGQVYTAEVTLSPMDYLMFVAEKDGQKLIMHSNWEFSTDGTSWDILGTTEPEFQNKMMFLRGKDNTNGTNGENIQFGNSEIKVACLGDIRTLVDYRYYATMTNANQIYVGEDDGPYIANFKGLFKECTVLTSAPALPFTTLSKNCYLGMFVGCTSLTTAPELPATILSDNCYRMMFYDCEKLNNVTMLATDISADNCLYDWLLGVALTGSFTKASSVEESEVRAKYGIPDDWIVVDYEATND